jgi:hypothetical protein
MPSFFNFFWSVCPRQFEVIMPARDTYEAKLKDDSLQTLVGECLKLLEYTFAFFDADGAK